MEFASASGLVDSLSIADKAPLDGDLVWNNHHARPTSQQDLAEMLTSGMASSNQVHQVQRCQQTSSESSPLTSPVECRSVGTVTAEEKKTEGEVWARLEQVIRNASQIVIRGLQEADGILAERMLLEEKDEDSNRDSDMALLAQFTSRDACKSKPILIQRGDSPDTDEGRPKPAVRFAESAVLYQELLDSGSRESDSFQGALAAHAIASKTSDGDGDSNSTMGRSSDASLKFERIQVRTKLQDTGSASSLSLPARLPRDKRPDWASCWRPETPSPPSPYEPAEALEEDLADCCRDFCWKSEQPEPASSLQPDAHEASAIAVPESQPPQSQLAATNEPVAQEQPAVDVQQVQDTHVVQAAEDAQAAQDKDTHNVQVASDVQGTQDDQVVQGVQSLQDVQDVRVGSPGSPATQPMTADDGSVPEYSSVAEAAAVNNTITAENSQPSEPPSADETKCINDEGKIGKEEPSRAEPTVLRLREAPVERAAPAPVGARAFGRRATDIIRQAAPRTNSSSSPRLGSPDALADIFLSPAIPDASPMDLDRSAVSVQTSPLISQDLPKHLTPRERAMAMIQHVDSQLNAIFNNRTLTSTDALPFPTLGVTTTPSPRPSLSQGAACGGTRGPRLKHGKLSTMPRKKTTNSPAQQKPGQKSGGKQAKGSAEDKTVAGPVVRKHLSRGSKPDRKATNPQVGSKGAGKGKPCKQASRSPSGARPPFGIVPERGQTTRLQNTIRATPMEILFDPADMATRTAVDRIPMSSYFAAALDSARSSDAQAGKDNEVNVNAEPTAYSPPDPSAANAGTVPSPRDSLIDTITSILQIDVDSLVAGGASKTPKDAFVSVYDIPSGTRSSLINYDTGGLRTTETGEELTRKVLKTTPGKLNLNQHRKYSAAIHASDRKNLKVAERALKRPPESSLRGTAAKGGDGTKISESRYVHSRGSTSLHQNTVRQPQGVRAARVISSTQSQLYRTRNVEVKESFEATSSAGMNDLTARPSKKFKSFPEKVLEGAASAPLPLSKLLTTPQLNVIPSSVKVASLQKSINMWDEHLDGAVAKAKHVIAAVTKVISTASNTIANAERTIHAGVSIP